MALGLTYKRSLSTGAANAVKAAEAAAQAPATAAMSQPQLLEGTDPPVTSPPAPPATPACVGIGGGSWSPPQQTAAVGLGVQPISAEDVIEALERERKRANERMTAKEELMAVAEESVLETKEDLEAMYELEDKLVQELSRPPEHTASGEEQWRRTCTYTPGRPDRKVGEIKLLRQYMGYVFSSLSLRFLGMFSARFVAAARGKNVLMEVIWSCYVAHSRITQQHMLWSGVGEMRAGNASAVCAPPHNPGATG
jgi:hypothetical protein